MEKWQSDFLIFCLIVLVVMAVFIFIRVVKGPRLLDRIMGVNMMGTVTICMLALVSILQNESYLIDICIIYAVISFLAVVVLSKIYMGVFFSGVDIHKHNTDKLKAKRTRKHK